MNSWAEIKPDIPEGKIYKLRCKRHEAKNHFEEIQLQIYELMNNIGSSCSKKELDNDINGLLSHLYKELNYLDILFQEVNSIRISKLENLHN